MADEPVSLTVVMNEVEAEMIRGLLSSAGIDSMERPSSSGAGVAPGLIPGGATEIYVRRCAARGRAGAPPGR